MRSLVFQPAPAWLTAGPGAGPALARGAA